MASLHHGALTSDPSVCPHNNELGQRRGFGQAELSGLQRVPSAGGAGDTGRRVDGVAADRELFGDLGRRDPASSIWLMPLARWASVSAVRWSLATIWTAMRSAVLVSSEFVSRTYTGMLASCASRAARVRRCPSFSSRYACVASSYLIEVSVVCGIPG